MNRQTHDNTVAPPSQTVLALTLPSTAHQSLDPLWGNDLSASAVALGLAQQQQQLQIPFWPQQQQGSEMWPHSCQSQTRQTPRWPLGMARPTPPTPQGMTSHRWTSPSPPPPTWDATSIGLSVDKTTRALDGIRVEKDIREVDRPPWNHGPRSGSEVGLSGTRGSTETLATGTQFLET